MRFKFSQFVEAFNDIGKHYLRSDSDDLDAWYNLSVQGSSEAEALIANNTDYDLDEFPIQSSDKLTGDITSGIWFKGFSKRRWETVILGYREDGKISPMRPLLDYSLTWIDEDEDVRFDSVSTVTETKKYLPYVPHTTGSAGLFYQERLNELTKTRNRTSPIKKY